MLLLRLFLLVMLIHDSSSASNVLTLLVEDCDKMTCFSYPECLYPDLVSPTMVLIPPGAKVTDKCDAIAKIRSYSRTHYLIALESHAIRGKFIKFQQGTAEFECVKDANSKVSAKSVTGDYELSIIEAKSSPLSCQFYVRGKDGKDVFLSGADIEDVKLSSSSFDAGATFDGAAFLGVCKPTCDPDKVQPSSLGGVGDKTVSKVDVQLADLKCPAEKKLMFRKDSSSEFVDATSITCVKTGTVYAFEPKLVEAQCAITTCTQCNLSMAPPVPNIETYSEGGCTKLRCKNGDRMKIGSADAVEGSAECKYDNNQHLWQLNGVSIKADSTVECQGKVKCFSTEADVKKVCKDCTLGPDNMPKCVVETATLKYQSLKMGVACNEVTGKYAMKDDTQEYTMTEFELHCEDQNALDAAADAEKQKAAKASQELVLYIVIPLVLLAALAGVGFFVWRHLQKRKREAPPSNEKKAAEEGQKKNRTDTKSAKSGGNSLESKTVKSAEERARIAEEARKQLEEERRKMVDEAVKNLQLRPAGSRDGHPGDIPDTQGQEDNDNAGTGYPDPLDQKLKRPSTDCGPMPTPAVPITGGRSRIQKKPAA